MKKTKFPGDVSTASLGKGWHRLLPRNNEVDYAWEGKTIFII
jgi:hypothetical protein